MFKNPTRNLAFGLLLVLLAGPVDRAFASGTDSTSAPSPSSTVVPAPTEAGPTGTDPEPIEPDIVSLILTIISLA
jgi:hypothetical protein